MPRLFSHSFVHYPADRLRDGGIDFRYGRRNFVEDGVDDILFGRTAERLPSCECLITDHAKRENIRLRRYRLELDLLRSHVQQSALLEPIGARASVNGVDDTEIY